MGKIRLIIVLLIILGLFVYLLFVTDFSNSEADKMANEHRIIEQSGVDVALKEAENTEPPEKKNEAVTAQEVLIEMQGTTENVPILDNEEIIYQKGLFSWEDEVRQPENRASLYVTIEYLGINEVYQDFTGVDAGDKQAKDLARELELLGIDLYLLTGNSDWSYQADGAPMLVEVQRAQGFREAWGADALKGIVFDIEPYGSDRWKQGEKTALMQNLVSGMKVAYNAAKDKGLRVILVIPTWYDQHYNEYFVELSRCCDELSVMNYVRKDEYINIANEVEYARALEMDVTCIFEFQRVGWHNLTEEETYYNDGIDAAVESFEKLYRKLGYPNLKFAFHYLKPIEELLFDWQS